MSINEEIMLSFLIGHSRSGVVSFEFKSKDIICIGLSAIEILNSKEVLLELGFISSLGCNQYQIANNAFELNIAA